MSSVGKLARQEQEKPRGTTPLPLDPFRVVPHDFGFDPKVDLDKMNSLADELATIEDTRKLGKK